MNATTPHEDDKIGTPWIIKQIDAVPPGLLTTNDIVLAVTSPGRDHVQTASMVRHFQKVGYIHPVARVRTGRRPYVYTPDQILSAEVLLRLGEFGIADANAMHAAWFAISIWKDIDFDAAPPPSRSPGAHVIKQYKQGARDWSFELWLFRDMQTGQRRYEARIAANQRAEATSMVALRDTNFKARSVFAVDLVDFLDDKIHLFDPMGVN